MHHGLRGLTSWGKQERESDITAPLVKTLAPVVTAGPHMRGEEKAKQDISRAPAEKDAGKGEVKPKVCGINFIGCLTDQIRSGAWFCALNALWPVRNAFSTL